MERVSPRSILLGLAESVSVMKSVPETCPATIVPSPFMNALNREQNPIRVTYKHHQTVL